MLDDTVHKDPHVLLHNKWHNWMQYKVNSLQNYIIEAIRPEFSSEQSQQNG